MVTHADAAIFGDDVSLADLAKLSPEAFNSLKDVEFAVFTAKVKHAGAVEAEKKFREVNPPNRCWSQRKCTSRRLKPN